MEVSLPDVVPGEGAEGLVLALMCVAFMLFLVWMVGTIISWLERRRDKRNP